MKIIPTILWASFLISCIALAQDSIYLSQASVLLWVTAVAITSIHWWQKISLSTPVSSDFEQEKIALGRKLEFSGIGGADIFSWINQMAKSPAGYLKFRKTENPSQRDVLRSFGAGCEYIAFMMACIQSAVFIWGASSVLPSYYVNLPDPLGKFAAALAIFVAIFIGWITTCLTLVRLKSKL